MNSYHAVFLVVALNLVVLATNVGCGAPETTRTAGLGLSAQQCEHFQVGGKVTICHRTSSAKNPYVIIKVNTQGCVNGHAAHAGDYVAIDDPTCNGQGCFPAGAPHDGTVECCDYLWPDASGTCAPVVCPADTACTKYEPNRTGGGCTAAHAAAATPCDDGDATTSSDRCDGAGLCAGETQVACPCWDVPTAAQEISALTSGALGSFQIGTGTTSVADGQVDFLSVATETSSLAFATGSVPALGGDLCATVVGGGAPSIVAPLSAAQFVTCTNELATLENNPCRTHNGGCVGQTPICVYTKPGSATCLECTSDLDCEGSPRGARCVTATGVCAPVCPANTACTNYTSDATCTPTHAGTTTSCDDGDAATGDDRCDGLGGCRGVIVCPCWDVTSAASLVAAQSLEPGATIVSASESSGLDYYSYVYVANSADVFAYYAGHIDELGGDLCATYVQSVGQEAITAPISSAQLAACTSDLATIKNDPCQDNNGGCASPTSVCVYERPGASRCAECASDSDCELSANGPSCDVAAGSCTVLQIDACIEHPCANGTCTDLPAPAPNDASGRTCTCDSGYALVEGACQNIDACNGNPCGGLATCLDLPPPAPGDSTGRTCSCGQGYEYVSGACQDINACINNPCGGGAACQDHPPPARGDASGRFCICSEGYSYNYSTNACESICPAGTYAISPPGMGTQCVNIDACAANPCPSTQMTCTDLPPPALGDAAGRICACPAGTWAHTYPMGMGTFCENINACDAYPCGANELCADSAPPAPGDASGRTCTCKPGFVVIDGACACPERFVNINGSCVSCPADTECRTYATYGSNTCVAIHASSATTCNDGKPGTYADRCDGAGSCVGTPVVCPATTACTTAYTTNGTSSCTPIYAPPGTSCTDGNACTQTDTCAAGVCVGANPKVCSASDQCHTVGVCEPSSGACSNPVLTAQWSATTSLPAPLWVHASVAYNGFLYVSGGGNASSATYFSDVRVAPINANGTLGAFVSTTSLPSGRHGHATVAYNGFFYVLGGYGTSGLNTVHVAPINANGTLGAFTATTSFSGARWYHASVGHNGFMYVIAGYSSYSDVQVAPINANGTLGAWSATASVPGGARWVHTTALRNGFLYVIGGDPGPRSDVQVARVNANGTVGPWAATTSLPSPRGLHGTVAYNGSLHVLGGYGTGTVRRNDVVTAPLNGDGTLGAFGTTVGNFATARYSPVSVEYNGYLYVIGGNGTGNIGLTDVQVYPLAGVTCDDGNPGTHADACNASGVCAGTPVACPADTPCVTYTPNGTSTCTPTYAQAGTTCNDNNPSTHTDTCNGSGVCAGTPVTCPANTACTTYTVSGTACTAAYAPSGAPCNDGDLGTHTDVCNGSGGCGGTPMSCPPNAVCVTYALNGTAACTPTYASTSTACNDGDVGTHTDRCNGVGACTGTAVSCPANTTCTTYAANGTTTCVATHAAAGTSCDDGNAGTLGDVCNNGVCGGAYPPLTLAYSANPASYVVGQTIVNNLPIVSGGTVTSYSIGAAFSATGLSINTTTGVISGVPTSPSCPAQYVVTATNAAGSITAVVTIGVASAASTMGFHATGNLSAARQYHFTATLLLDGRVLLVGGIGASTFVPGADLYDPGTGTFTAAGSLISVRQRHTATLLLDGRVLVTGGNGPSGYLSKAEVYNPATRTFSATGDMTVSRGNHTATLLPSGKVLIFGGYGGTANGFAATAELYDPATGTFALTGTPRAGRTELAATRLADGRVLFAGGYGPSGYLESAELYNPATGTFAATGGLGSPRFRHTSALLPDGRVLVAFGENALGRLTSAAVYEPGSGTFTATGSASTVRQDGTATLMQSGLVLVTGGYAGGSAVLASAELYNPASGTFAPTASLLTTRYRHTATLLNNGRVLVAGGSDVYGALDKAEEYFGSDSGCVACAAVVCTASDQCHFAGLCDPATGACSNPPAPNGTACSDGNECTVLDSCQGGSCSGSAAANGTACSDGNVCTVGDSCQGGFCASGTTDGCAPPPTTMVGFGVYFPAEVAGAGLPKTGSYLMYARSDFSDGASQYPHNTLVTWSTIVNSACTVDGSGYIQYVRTGYGFCAIQGVYTDPTGRVWTAAPVYTVVQNAP